MLTPQYPYPESHLILTCDYVLVDLAEIQAAYYMVAATGVLVAAAYYILNLRVSQRNQELSTKTQELALKAQQQNLETRQAQLFSQLYSNMMTPETNLIFIKLLNMEWRDIDDFERKYGSDSNPENFAERSSQWNFYDHIGFLAKNGILDADKVYEAWGWHIIWMWEKFEDVFLHMRKQYNIPESLLHFEYIYGEVKKIRSKRGVSVETPKEFAKYMSRNDKLAP